MERLIKTGEELKEWFFKAYSLNKPGLLAEGVMVDTKIRREVLTDINQGKTIINGKVRTIQFKSIGGGVYRASIEA